MRPDVRWYEERVRYFTTVAPVAAHSRAALEAAGIGARLIRSTYTGTLARDVSRPKPVAPLVTEVGSRLPYAAIENWGGVIVPRRYPFLYIRGRQGRTRSGGGEIVAVAKRVRHRGKFYLHAVAATFPDLFNRNLRALLGGAARG